MLKILSTIVTDVSSLEDTLRSHDHYVLVTPIIIVVFSLSLDLLLPSPRYPSWITLYQPSSAYRIYGD